MRVALIGLLFMVVAASPAWGFDDHYDGTAQDAYQEGYGDGYTYRRPYALRPLPPLAPLPRLGESKHDMYLRGALKGMNRRRESGLGVFGGRRRGGLGSFGGQ